jgi:hypothetical protein
MTRSMFLVERKRKKNFIAFEDAAAIREKAAKGYVEQLLKTERINIRCKTNTYSPQSQKGFLRIKGVAAKEGGNATRYPDCVAWFEYEDGTSKFINRSSCREAPWRGRSLERGRSSRSSSASYLSG